MENEELKKGKKLKNKKIVVLVIILIIVLLVTTFFLKKISEKRGITVSNNNEIEKVEVKKDKTEEQENTNTNKNSEETNTNNTITQKDKQEIKNEDKENKNENKETSKTKEKYNINLSFVPKYQYAESLIGKKTYESSETDTIIDISDYSYLNMSTITDNCVNEKKCPTLKIENNKLIIKNLSSDISININYTCNHMPGDRGIIKLSYDDLLCIQNTSYNNYFLLIYFNEDKFEYQDTVRQALDDYCDNKDYCLNDTTIFYFDSSEDPFYSYVKEKYPSGNVYYLAYIKGINHLPYNILLGERTKSEIMEFAGYSCVGC